MNIPKIVPLEQYVGRLNESGIGVLLVDRQGVCQEANAEACRLLGYGDAELRQLPVTTLLVNGNDQGLHAGFSARRLPFHRADGSLLHVLATSTRIAGDALLLEFQDITGLAQEIENLSRREMHYRGLVELSCDWMWEVDTEGVYTYVSPRVRTLLGFEPNEVIGKTPFDLMPPDEAGRCRRFFAEIADRRESFSAFENINLHKDGRQVVLESSGMPVFDEEGRYLGYRGTDRDITQRKQVEQALESNREMLAAAQRIAHIGNWEWDASRQRYEFSEEMYRILGVSPEDFIATPEAMLEMIHPNDRQLVRLAMERMQRQHKPICVEHRIIRRDGKERILEVRAEIRRNESTGEPRILGTTQDITDLRRTERGLRQLTQALDNTREAVIILDSRRNVIATNQAFTRMTGFREEDILGRNPFELRIQSLGPRVLSEIWGAVGRDGRWEGELQGERSNGELYTEQLTISQLSDVHGQTVNYIVVMTDISKQKHSEEQLQYVATHDVMTGLPNRQRLSDEIRRRISTATRGFAVLMVDLDGFKTLNNSLGHTAGDCLIHACADRLQSSVRRGDFIARLSGDDFVVVLDGIEDEAEAMPVVDKLYHALAEPLLIDDEEIDLSACTGVAFHPAHGTYPEALLQHAETALLHARQQGRNLCHYYTPEMSTNVSEQFSLERALRRALRSGEGLSAHYQPQIDAASGKAVGVEALMRWNHPELGPVSPARFIPIAEQSDLINDICAWMLNTACADLRRWLDAGLPAVRMSINISNRDITSGALVDNIRDTIDRYRIPPDLLEVEITERSLIADTMRAHAMLQELTQLGVFISVDDFGTGYSSLSYLKSFPLNILKIDKSFVDGIPGDEHDEAIACAVIAMAHGLKLQVTAEGVETEAQKRFLQEHGCDFLQGYLITEPLPAAKFARWLADNA